MQTQPQIDQIRLQGAPNVDGLVFRRFRGESDYPHIVDILEASRQADGGEWPTALEDVARQYRHLVNCDPERDVYLAEIDGQPVAYARVWWQRLLDGTYICRHMASVIPAWRHTALRRVMLRENERLIRERMADQEKAPRLYEAWAEVGEDAWAELLVAEGYEPVRYFFSMVRPHLEDIPDLPLPPGIEIRPAKPEHYRAIWDADTEAFRDHWGCPQPHEEWYASWLESPYIQPELWQVAWEGDQVVGQVLNFINEQENAEHGRKRGYTEDISVRRPWRRRGIARALIARSLRVLEERGMEEAALGVDVDNPSGALRLYESLGYVRDRHETCYRKPLP